MEPQVVRYRERPELRATIPRSLHISGTVGEWEARTQMPWRENAGDLD